jgi:type II secretory pathway pseudopilin PulG
VPAPALNTPLARHAFSIVEAIVVIVIIGVLAGVTVPRLMGGQARRAALEADALANLLSLAAQRSSISSRPMAVVFEEEDRRFSLRVETRSVEEDQPARWDLAAMIRPVPLDASDLDRLVIGGREGFSALAPAARAAKAGTTAADGALPRGPRIDFDPARAREPVSIVLTLSDSSGRAWQIDLLPGQTSATVRPLENPSQWRPPETSAIDLDETGLRETPW